MINNKNQKGYVLASVITLSALVFIVGSSALYMASMGSQTASSEIQYNKAKEASEYALNKAVYEISKQITEDNPVFVQTANKVKLNDSGAFYSYKTSPDSKNNNCFIYAEGTTAGGSKVVQTTVIPIKPPDIFQQSPMSSDTLEGFTPNGSGQSIGNDCGGPGVTLKNPPPTKPKNIKELLEGERGAAGTPSLKVDPNLPNRYETTFGEPITNRQTLDTAIDTRVNLQMASTPSNCKVDGNLTPLVPTNCSSLKGDKNNAKIKCITGKVEKIIDTNPNVCPNVVIRASSMTVNKGTPIANENMVVSVSGDMTLQSGVSGLWVAEDVLNISDNGNETYDGVFIGGDADYLSLGGGTQFNGLYFIGNDDPNKVVEVEMTLGGRTNISGAIQVAGKIKDLTRNGGANNHGIPYDITYDHNKINKWGNKYAGLLKEFKCEKNTPKSIYASIQKTKMALY